MPVAGAETIGVGVVIETHQPIIATPALQGGTDPNAGGEGVVAATAMQCGAIRSHGRGGQHHRCAERLIENLLRVAAGAISPFDGGKPVTQPVFDQQHAAVVFEKQVGTCARLGGAHVHRRAKAQGVAAAARADGFLLRSAAVIQAVAGGKHINGARWRIESVDAGAAFEDRLAQGD